MASSTPQLQALEAHRQRWGEPTVIGWGPGRVNLIGEHTDYNDGFAMPMALRFGTAVAISSDGDPHTGRISAESVGFGDVTFTLNDDPAELPSWVRYLYGVSTLLAEHDVPTGGWRATIATDIPTGASLSSSAAIEVALITALLARADRAWEPLEIARLGQRVENEIIGLPSGIMDQFISAGAVAGSASVMDCRSLTLTPAPIPPDVVVAVMDTQTRRTLADAAYGERRASCERAAADLGVAALRDASVAEIDRITDVTDRRRAHHVITENQRTLDGANALRDGDVHRFGKLMSASHASLRDDYEVSGPGLNAIVDIAHDAPGCLGARMTGGGFAGCAVALVDRTLADEFTDDVVNRYDYDGNTADVWLCEPADGARAITP